MALNINAAKLYNYVIYATDMPSLAKVKKQMEDLKNSIQKTTKNASLVNAQAEIANAKKVTKSVKDEAAKQQKAYKITLPQAGTGRGTGMVGNATYYARDSATVARQTAQMYNSRSAAEKALEAQKKKAQAAAAKNRKEALNRDIKGTMALRKASFDLNRIQGQSGAERYKNIQQARDITKAYREGRIELVEMNEQMRQLRANAGAAARNSRKITRQNGKSARSGNSQYLLGLGLASTAAAVAVGAGYASYRNLDTASTRGHNLRQIEQQVGVPANALNAIVQWGQQHGVDSANTEKIQDNMKDMNENIGDFVLNAKRNSSGEWSGGGRLTETANALQLSKEDIAKFEGKPMEAFNMIVNRSIQLGLSKAIGSHLLENAADDSMYYYEMYKNDGIALIDTMAQRNQAGVSYRPGDLESLDNMYAFNFALKQGAEALQNRFVVGMAKSITGTQDLNDAFKILRPQVEQLGSAMGSLFNGIMKLIDWLPTSKVNEMQGKLKSGGVTMADGDTIRSDGTWRDWIPAPIQDAFGIGINAASPATMFNRENMVMAGATGYSNPAQQLVFSPQLSVIPNITLTPDSSGFSSLIDARADAAILQYERNAVLGMYGSTTNNNN